MALQATPQKRRQAAALQIGKLPAQGADMQTADNGSIAEITEAISARLHAQWDGWKNRDAASNNAIIADDFTSFWPDGSRHVGKPTAQQTAEQPISRYTLSESRGAGGSGYGAGHLFCGHQSSWQ